MERELRLVKSVFRVVLMLLFGVFWYYAGYSVGFGAGADEVRFSKYAETHAQVDERADASQDPMPTLSDPDTVVLSATTPDGPGR